MRYLITVRGFTVAIYAHTRAIAETMHRSLVKCPDTMLASRHNETLDLVRQYPNLPTVHMG